MTSRIEDLCRKDVININDGSRLGNISDVEIDMESGKVTGLVIYGRLKIFGLFGREDDVVVPWSDISKIGEDIVLVTFNLPFHRRPKPRRAFFSLFK